MCCFIEGGETVSLSFGTENMQKLTEAIQNLQQIYQILCDRRQQQISRELESISPKIPILLKSIDDTIGF